MNVEQRLEFAALEYNADCSLDLAHYAFEGSPDAGWRISRNGARHLRLGPGYRVLRTRCCGVCSTDLDRHNLPFELPQIIGHELVADDGEGGRCVVEINASHAARGVASGCVYCRSGLDRHCPERLVVGIHDLPGGFGPYVLAPTLNVIALPDAVPDECAVLIEPFAAALRAVDRMQPRPGDVVGVLGTRRLGQLVIAALAARRRERGGDLRIRGFSRHASLRDLSRMLGADDAMAPPEATAAPAADLVVDTTASPEGLLLAIAMARREVHLKSTHGRPSAGLRHLTELVVDEISLCREPDDETTAASALRDLAVVRPDGRAVMAWLAGGEPPAHYARHAHVEVFDHPAAAQAALAMRGRDLPGADVVVVDDAASIDASLRPSESSQISLVRPTGEIWLRSTGTTRKSESPLVAAIAGRDLRLSSSRCGSFRDALALLESDEALRASLRLLITHRFPASALGEALDTARGPDCIKVLVDHDAPGDAAG